MENPFIKRPLPKGAPKTNLLHKIIPPSMNRIQKVTRLSVISCMLVMMLYMVGSTIAGVAPRSDAKQVTDPLEKASNERLELLKALRAENEEKAKKESALKETNENIEILKQKDAEKQKAIEVAVTTPIPKE